jgi:hypothetical protein
MAGQHVLARDWGVRMQKASSAKRSLVRAQCSDPPEVGEAGFNRLFLGGVEGEDLIDLVGVHRGGMILGR